MIGRRAWQDSAEEFNIKLYGKRNAAWMRCLWFLMNMEWIEGAFPPRPTRLELEIDAAGVFSRSRPRLAS